MKRVTCPACESGWRRADELSDYRAERAPQHLVRCPVCAGRGIVNSHDGQSRHDRRPGRRAHAGA